MPDITLEQRTLLGEIRRAKEARASVRARVEAENRQRLEAATRDAEDLLSRKVREAFEAGISKRQIGREGLGTKDPTIVNRTLEKTAGAAAVAAAVATVAAAPPIRELSRDEAAAAGYADDDAELFVALHYPHFPTRARAADYPDPLTGVLKRVFGLWYVLEDPSELFLAWELDELEPNGDVLPKVLNAYAERALAVR